MQTTPNLNLTLPEPQDWADVEQLNASFRAIDDFANRKDNPHSVTAKQVGAATPAFVCQKISEIPDPDVSGGIKKHDTSPAAHSNIRGKANGIASLDADGKVPEGQLDMGKIAKAVLPLFSKWEGGTF